MDPVVTRYPAEQIINDEDRHRDHLNYTESGILLDEHQWEYTRDDGDEHQYVVDQTDFVALPGRFNYAVDTFSHERRDWSCFVPKVVIYLDYSKAGICIK